MNATFSLISFATAAALLFGATSTLAQGALKSGAADDKATRVSGPFTHDRLTIYLIHGASADGPVPLTLSEALARKVFKVFETGSVNELAFENLGDEPVFLQAGDIVKGGRQDRVLTTSVLVPPNSGRLPIAAYCVEQHRWSARGGESAQYFASSEKAMPSKSAKLAMYGRSVDEARPSGGAPAQRRPAPSAQGEVWNSVADTQRKLSANLGASAADPASPSSLQLSLENEKLKVAKDAYIDKLSIKEKDETDVIGFAFAVDGRIYGADVYPSHGLFSKMWGKLVDAAATEAIGETKGPASPPPAPDAVLSFLNGAAAGQSEVQTVDENTKRVLKRNDAAVFSETQQADGKVVHRSVVAF